MTRAKFHVLFVFTAKLCKFWKVNNCIKMSEKQLSSKNTLFGKIKRFPDKLWEAVNTDSDLIRWVTIYYNEIQLQNVNKMSKHGNAKHGSQRELLLQSSASSHRYSITLPPMTIIIDHHDHVLFVLSCEVWCFRQRPVDIVGGGGVQVFFIKKKNWVSLLI